MSDNEDILGDELDHTLVDYNLGNDEEDQLLADDYDNGASQNVPPSMGNFVEQNDINTSYSVLDPGFNSNIAPYMPPEPECVVPNISVEVRTPTYAPYEPPQHVPQPLPAAPIEPPQIVPSENIPHTSEPTRDHFPSERPPGGRTPQQRVIPDTLDAVVVPRGPYNPRARMWRPAINRYNHPYKKTNVFRGHFLQQNPNFPPRLPEMPLMRPPPMFRMERPRFPPRFTNNTYRPRQTFNANRQREINNENIPQVTITQPIIQQDNNRLNISQPLPAKIPKMLPETSVGNEVEKAPVIKEPEVRMLPMPMPSSLPVPLSLPNVPAKKVLINPHFKGNFPVANDSGVATYIPTRISKSPPLPVVANADKQYGNPKDIDDAAERFIAEQRSALARAANRNLRRSPPRFVDSTRISIVNDTWSGTSRSRQDEELLRKQEEFIQANRQVYRRRVRSPSPPRPRRSPSPERYREDRRRPKKDDEDYEYRRKLAEQESLRERVLRAKEIRRRKNAIQHHNEISRPRSPVKPQEPNSKETKKDEPKKEIAEKKETGGKTETKEATSTVEEVKEKEKSPPPARPPRPDEPEGNLTPPLPPAGHRRPSLDRRPSSSSDLLSSGDDLDLILGDIEGILSDGEETRDKGQINPPCAKSKTPPRSDLRSKLPPRNKQKIVFNREDRDDNDDSRRAKTPPLRRNVVTSSTENKKGQKKESNKSDTENVSRPRQRIVFDNKEKEHSPPKEKEQKPAETTEKPKFPNRRVILQRKVTNPTPKSPQKSVFSRIEIKTSTDPTKPNPGIFSRAVRTALSSDNNRIVIKKSEEPEIEYGSDDDEKKEIIDTCLISIKNLPPGFTEARVRSLAGSQLQTISLDKDDRSAQITFKNSTAAESFKRKFNNKMVAASRLSVELI